MGESVTFLKHHQGQTLFPAVGLRPDFKPKLREDGTLNCFGALEVILVLILQFEMALENYLKNKLS